MTEQRRPSEPLRSSSLPRSRRGPRRRAVSNLPAARRCCAPSSTPRSSSSTPRRPRSRCTTRPRIGSCSGVAAGAQGQGVVGVSIAPHEGVAGYVFSTGQPIAIVDVAADPRFGASTAQQTGYVPRSILAVPLLDVEDSLGVLEILDRRSGEGFALRDVELAGVFARQATVAIRATRLERGTALLRAVGAVAVDAEGGERGGAEDGGRGDRRDRRSGVERVIVALVMVTSWVGGDGSTVGRRHPLTRPSPRRLGSPAARDPRGHSRG